MRKRWAVIAAVIWFIAGCGGGVDGVEVTGVPQEQWDPCSIPADAIAGTGLDPASKREGFGDGIVVDDWSMCIWEGRTSRSDYYYRVLFSVQHKLDDVRTNPVYTNFRDIASADHAWVEYRPRAFSVGDRCDVAFETPAGVVTTAVEVFGGLPPMAAACETVYRHTAELIAFFPPQS